MSAYSCAQLREVAPELALGVLGGAERAEALIHVNGCARCQALVNELTEVADAIPMLGPSTNRRRGSSSVCSLRVARERRRRNRGGWRRSRRPRRQPPFSASPSSAWSTPGTRPQPVTTASEPVKRAMMSTVGQAGGVGLRHERSVGRDRGRLRRRIRRVRGRGAPARAARRSDDRDHDDRRQPRIVDRQERRPASGRQHDLARRREGAPACHGTVERAE